MQTFVNANAGSQTVVPSGVVNFSESINITPGISYDGVGTFTIQVAGLYALQAALNFAADTPANSVFSVNYNGVTLAPGANSGTSGQIAVLRVGNYAVGDTLSIVNISVNNVTLVNGISGGGALDDSSGHICLFRFADGPFV